MFKFIMVLSVLGLTSNISNAEEMAMKGMSKKMPTLTAEQRLKMADAHDKMAICLRSAKPLDDCHEEMMKSCKENMGKEGCPMAGGMGMRHHK